MLNSRYIVSLALVYSLCAVGCATNKSNRLMFPDDIAPMCHRAMAQAKADIEACGTPLKFRSGIAVVKMLGEKKIDGKWAYHDPQSGRLVYAQYVGWRIEVGCNPVTLGEVDYGCLHHEFGHYWLGTNYKEHGHPSRYDSKFGWSWIDDCIKEK